jgi:hypothetical protein
MNFLSVFGKNALENSINIPKNSNPQKSNSYFFDTLTPILSQEIFSPFQKSHNISLLGLEQVIYMQ